jgi:hypothetical protein
LSEQSSRALGAPGSSPGARLENCGQGAQVELDQSSGVLGLLPAFGHDQRNGVADVIHLLLGEDARIDVKPQRGDRERERDAIAGEHRPQIGIGQDRPNAGQGPRLVDVHALQQPVGDRAADEGRVQQVRQVDVVDEPSSAAQQLCILQARDRSAHKSRSQLTMHGRACRRTTD